MAENDFKNCMSCGILLVVALGACERVEPVFPSTPSRAANGEVYESALGNLPNTSFLDQDGKAIRFYSDLVKDKAVILNFIFTTCEGSCPISAGTFGEIQQLLARRGDSSINLVSISTDPDDTPERLKRWAARFGAQPGWTLLSGSEAAVEEVAMALQGAPARKGEHVASVLIGQGGSKRWTRVHASQDPAALIEIAKASGTETDPLAP